MTNRNLLLIPAALLMGGCVSNSDFATAQNEIRTLNAKMATMQTEMSQLQNELATVKGQRLIRLPTGAPTKTEARKPTRPVYATSEADRLFNAAVEQYQSGDAQGAAVKFEQFVRQQPNAKQRPEALFYLGQAYYTVRNYAQAELALEALVIQTPAATPNAKAVDLLKKVYQAQGKANKATELDTLLHSRANPASAPISTPANTTAPIQAAPPQTATANSSTGIFEQPTTGIQSQRYAEL